MSLTAGLVAFSTLSCRVNGTGGLSTEHYSWTPQKEANCMRLSTQMGSYTFREEKRITFPLVDKVE